MEAVRLTPYSTRQLLALYLAWLAIGIHIFLTAWVAEDAYITFRVIDNFMHGYGLRWNIHERVQAYTHPLWMLLHIPLYALWPNIFHVTLALSIACSMAALIVVLTSVRKPLFTTLGCFFLPLALSKAFIDYATSGLETPLSFLLYAAFGYTLLRLQEHRYFWFFCSLSVALALFNRLDVVFLYAPALLWLVLTHGRRLRWGQILLGALPLIGWLGFALFYYGFIFPNTKYAKLDTGIALSVYLAQGFHYLKFLFAYDTPSGLLLTFPLLVALAALLSPRWRGLKLALALGICAHVGYVLYIGGDYMAGRFWALPVFASVFLFYISLPDEPRPDIPFAALCLLVAAWHVPAELTTIRKNCGECMVKSGRIINARAVFGANRLVKNAWPLRLRQAGGFYYQKEGRKLAAMEPPPVQRLYFIGIAGYTAGPRPLLIDESGLADPLLARLPYYKKQSFYIGHFRRRIPKGYMEALRTGSTERMHPSLAEYYKKLRLIVSGDLMDPERLRTIVEFNTGKYDRYRDDYLHP
jgi:arabinofuranosyltransferase